MSLTPRIAASDQELAYRGKHFHDVRVVERNQIVCSTCGSELSLKTPGKLFSHPITDTLQCEECHRSCQAKDVTAEGGEDVDTFCRLCGQEHGRSLRVCDNLTCRYAFCKKCIERNTRRSLKNGPSEGWKCFVCNAKPLWEARAICAAVIATRPKKSRNRNRKLSRRNPDICGEDCSSQSVSSHGTNAIGRNGDELSRMGNDRYEQNKERENSRRSMCGSAARSRMAKHTSALRKESRRESGSEFSSDEERRVVSDLSRSKNTLPSTGGYFNSNECMLRKSDARLTKNERFDRSALWTVKEEETGGATLERFKRSKRQEDGNKRSVVRLGSPRGCTNDRDRRRRRVISSDSDSDKESNDERNPRMRRTDLMNGARRQGSNGREKTRKPIRTERVRKDETESNSEGEFQAVNSPRRRRRTMRRLCDIDKDYTQVETERKHSSLVGDVRIKRTEANLKLSKQQGTTFKAHVQKLTNEINIVASKISADAQSANHKFFQNESVRVNDTVEVVFKYAKLLGECQTKLSGFKDEFLETYKLWCIDSGLGCVLEKVEDSVIAGPFLSRTRESPKSTATESERENEGEEEDVVSTLKPGTCSTPISDMRISDIEAKRGESSARPRKPTGKDAKSDAQSSSTADEAIVGSNTERSDVRGEKDRSLLPEDDGDTHSGVSDSGTSTSKRSTDPSGNRNRSDTEAESESCDRKSLKVSDYNSDEIFSGSEKGRANSQRSHKAKGMATNVGSNTRDDNVDEGESSGESQSRKGSRGTAVRFSTEDKLLPKSIVIKPVSVLLPKLEDIQGIDTKELKLKSKNDDAVDDRSMKNGQVRSADARITYNNTSVGVAKGSTTDGEHLKTNSIEDDEKSQGDRQSSDDMFDDTLVDDDEAGTRSRSSNESECDVLSKGERSVTREHVDHRNGDTEPEGAKQQKKRIESEDDRETHADETATDRNSSADRFGRDACDAEETAPSRGRELLEGRESDVVRNGSSSDAECVSTREKDSETRESGGARNSISIETGKSREVDTIEDDIEKGRDAVPEEKVRNARSKSSSEDSIGSFESVGSIATVAPSSTKSKSVTRTSDKEGSSSEFDTSCSTILLPEKASARATHDDSDSPTTSDKSKKSRRLSNGSADELAKMALLESTSDESPKEPSRDSDLNNADATAKRALLSSSDSESTTVESDGGRGDRKEDANATSDADSKRTRNSEKQSRDNDGRDSENYRPKRKMVKLNANPFYEADDKLKMTAKVVVERLGRRVLDRFSYVLEKSRKRLEEKNFASLLDLDSLERKKAIVRSNADSSEGDEATSKLPKGYKRKRKEKADEEKEETLMDHLEKVASGKVIETDGEDSDESSNIDGAKLRSKLEALPTAKTDLATEANRIAKDALLNSSDSNSEGEELSGTDDNGVRTEKKGHRCNDKKGTTTTTEKKEEAASDTEDDEEKLKKSKKTSKWRRDKVLTMTLTDSDSDSIKGENLRRTEKDSSNSDDDIKEIKVTKTKRRVLLSDSDSVKLCEDDSNSDGSTFVKKQKRRRAVSEEPGSSDDSMTAPKKKKKKKRKRLASKTSNSDSSVEETRSKPKRRRIKRIASDSDSDSDVVTASQGTPGKSGRKNIRKVLKNKQVADDTKQAAKEEEERLRRIAERHKLYNEMYEIRLAGEEKVDKLVLDFDEETKEELVSVHKDLVKRLKPHQAQGIKFMWDACFESLERVKTTKGSGCIIAHCMGLGKTFQVVTLAHTLLAHPETRINTIMVVCPLSTVLNWVNEFKMWLKDVNDGEDVNIFELTRLKRNCERKYQLEEWQRCGGVLIIGYEMFRNLSNGSKMGKNMKEAIFKCLVDPGPDLIVCDEGHLLKNEDTALSKAMRRVKTLRRIVLTGTPLQNNLIEYHCMVQFVKPNLLGTKKEFLNRFVNPITNGQFDDSTAYDVKLMKKRAHVLHKMLEGSVQRFDYSVLTPFLPPKQEYVIFVKLTDVQIKLYRYYLDNLARRYRGAGGSLFSDFQALQRIWTHPIVLKLNAEKAEKANEKKRLNESDSEGSLRDFIDDGSDSNCNSSSSSSSSSGSDIRSVHSDESSAAQRRGTRANPVEIQEETEGGKKDKGDSLPETGEATETTEWYEQFVQPEHFKDMRISAKLLLLFGILKECEQIGDKLLVFSQSLYSLTLIEKFLNQIDNDTQEGVTSEFLEGHSGSWTLGLDYFRLDGQTPAEYRSQWCKLFNKPSNPRARLFLISTRAGGLGINLTAANRVIIFDASWNPSHDVQSIFRVYRFGQKKPCYVYRFLAHGTMEEKIYNRQVTKLSLSCRVVDEQQIERHYSNNDLIELYKFEPNTSTDKPTLNLPKDRLVAEIFLKYKDYVENYHEHDSLLENKTEEELDEQERAQAWLEYEDEKKGKPPINPAMLANYQNNYIAQQQYMMMMMTNQQNSAGMDPNIASMRHDYENLHQLIRKDHPNLTNEQQQMLATRTIMGMYNYAEKQSTNQGPTVMGMNDLYARISNPNTTDFSTINAMVMQNQMAANYAAQQASARNANVIAGQEVVRNPILQNARTMNSDVLGIPMPDVPTSATRVADSSASTSNDKSQEE